MTFVYDRLKESNKLRQFVKEQKFFTFQKMFDKHDESVVKIVPKPILSKKDLHKIQNIPLHKRIGLSLQEFKDTNIFKIDEKDFSQRFTNYGHSIHWINRVQPAKDNKGYKPTNDFVWNGIEWELKSTRKAKYGSIKSLVKRGALSGIRKLYHRLERGSTPQEIIRAIKFVQQKQSKA